MSFLDASCARTGIGKARKSRNSTWAVLGAMFLFSLSGCSVRKDSPEERIGNFQFQYVDFTGYLRPADPSYLIVRHGRLFPKEVKAPDETGRFIAIEARLAGPHPTWLVSSASNFYFLKEASDGSVAVTPLPTTARAIPNAWIANGIATTRLDAGRWFVHDARTHELTNGRAPPYTGRILDERSLQIQLLPLQSIPGVDFDLDEIVSVSPDNSTAAWFSYLFSSGEKKGALTVVDKDGETMPFTKLDPLLYDDASPLNDAWTPWFNTFASWRRTKEGRWVVDIDHEKVAELVEKRRREKEAEDACRKRQLERPLDLRETSTTGPVAAVESILDCDPNAGKNAHRLPLRRNATDGRF
ncbi:hypothetical protein J2W24_002247 [Variovorax boronicumulans]|uniref:hypothetical protein n=1 Tax=Variovorax boronicumulans TaxID=436515 RepID=UPI00278851F9|nr:hypothetical protein [Variovorax boronicumulans]MDP9916600.1 hypothetical protein [Variovorax boronicumulans]